MSAGRESLTRGALLLCLAAAGAATADRRAADLEAAEAHWERRAEGRRGLRAAAGPVHEAIAAYERLLERDPASFEAMEGLLAALNFYGEYVLEDEAERLQTFARGRDLADRMRARLHTGTGLDPEERDPVVVAPAVAAHRHAAATYYHSAVHWGQWGKYSGKMKAARQGVAGRIRDYALIVLAIDEAFADGAALRLLGRLHTEAPRIPLVTGWVDRDESVERLERAVELAPGEPGGQLFLADALLRFRPRRRAEALERLEALVASEPREAKLVEDLNDIARARELLADARRAFRESGSPKGLAGPSGPAVPAERAAAPGCRRGPPASPPPTAARNRTAG